MVEVSYEFAGPFGGSYPSSVYAYDSKEYIQTVTRRIYLPGEFLFLLIGIGIGIGEIVFFISVSVSV